MLRLTKLTGALGSSFTYGSNAAEGAKTTPPIVQANQADAASFSMETLYQMCTSIVPHPFIPGTWVYSFSWPTGSIFATYDFKLVARINAGGAGPSWGSSYQLDPAPYWTLTFVQASIVNGGSGRVLVFDGTWDCLPSFMNIGGNGGYQPLPLTMDEMVKSISDMYNVENPTWVQSGQAFTFALRVPVGGTTLPPGSGLNFWATAPTTVPLSTTQNGFEAGLNNAYGQYDSSLGIFIPREPILGCGSTICVPAISSRVGTHLIDPNRWLSRSMFGVGFVGTVSVLSNVEFINA